MGKLLRGLCWNFGSNFYVFVQRTWKKNIVEDLYCYQDGRLSSNILFGVFNRSASNIYDFNPVPCKNAFGYLTDQLANIATDLPIQVCLFRGAFKTKNVTKSGKSPQFSCPPTSLRMIWTFFNLGQGWVQQNSGLPLNLIFILKFILKALFNQRN